MSVPADLIRLQSLVGSLPVALVIGDLAWEIQAWNAHAEKLYGWTAAEALGRHMSELVVAVDTWPPVEVVRQQVRSGQSWEGTCRVRGRDGRELLTHAIQSPIVDAAGTVTGIIGLAVDVTSEHDAGTTVLETVLANCPTSLTVVGPDDRIVSTVGDARTDNLAKSAYIGQLVSDLVPGVPFATMLHDARMGSAARQLVEFGDRQYDATTVMLPDRITGPGGVAFIATDITERTAEARLFQALVETVVDVISILDFDGGYRYLSPGAERLTGYRIDELMDTDHSSFERIHPADRPAVAAAFLEVTATPGAMVLQCFRLQHRDGTWRDVEQTIVNRTDDPTIGGLVAVARDVTARASAERRLLAISRMHAVLSETGVAMLRSTHPMQLLDETCRILVEVGGFPAAAFATEAPDAAPVTVLSECHADVPGVPAARTRAAMTDAVAGGGAVARAPSAVALFPIERREGLDGVLAVCSAPDGGALTDDESQQLVRLARNVAFALDALAVDEMRSAALRLSERRAQQQAITSSIGFIAGGTAGAAETISAAVAALTSFGLREVVLLETTPDPDALLIRATSGGRSPVVAGDLIVRSTAPMCASVLASGLTATADDLAVDPRFAAPPGSPFVPVGSAVAAPLRVDGATVAVLTVHSYDPCDLDEHDVRFVESVANVLSGSIARGSDEQSPAGALLAN